MLEPRKRTALDGKTWWCVFDADTMKRSTIVYFGKYKLKRDCQFAIDKYNRLYVESPALMSKSETELKKGGL